VKSSSRLLFAGALGLGLTLSACSSNGPPSAAHASSTESTRATGPTPSSVTSTTAPVTTTTTTQGSGAGGSGGSAGSPTLGVSGAFGASGAGFGEVKPAEISLGGDPTGVLGGITWQSWGGDQATGTGTSTYVGPGQTAAQGTVETATVVAFDLGTCKGAPAYQEVEWYFPEQGQTLASGSSSTIDACTGP
jgi:hypothetical protein